MTTIILTKTHIYADRQVSSDCEAGQHQCKECSSTSIKRTYKRNDSKIVIPETEVLYEGHRVLAIASSGFSHLIRKYTKLILDGKCPVQVVTDFKTVADFQIEQGVTMLVVTTDKTYRLIISPQHLNRRVLEQNETFSIGSGSGLAWALFKLFPTIKPLQAMSTIIEHDGGTGKAVDVFNYRAKRPVLKELSLDELPKPLKDMKPPK